MSSSMVYAWSGSDLLEKAGVSSTVRYHLTPGTTPERILEDLLALKPGGKGLILQNIAEIKDTFEGERDRYLGTLASEWKTWQDVIDSPITQGLERGEAWTQVFVGLYEAGEIPSELIEDFHGTPGKINRYDRAQRLLPDQLSEPRDGIYGSAAVWPPGTNWTHWRNIWMGYRFGTEPGQWFDIRQRLKYAIFTGPARRVFGPSIKILGYRETPDIRGQIAHTPKAYWFDKPDDMTFAEFAEATTTRIEKGMRVGVPDAVWLAPAPELDTDAQAYNDSLLKWCLYYNADVIWWNWTRIDDERFAEVLTKLRGAA